MTRNEESTFNPLVITKEDIEKYPGLLQITRPDRPSYMGVAVTSSGIRVEFGGYMRAIEVAIEDDEFHEFTSPEEAKAFLNAVLLFR